MKMYVGLLPVFDENMNVMYYSFECKSAYVKNIFAETMDETNTGVEIELVRDVGVDALSGGKPLMVNFNKFYVLSDTAYYFKPEDIFVTIMKTVPPDTDYIDKCRQMREAGYSLALTDFSFTEELTPYVEMASVIGINIYNPRLTQTIIRCRTINKNALLLAQNIPTTEAFEWAKKFGFNYFSGSFFSRPVAHGVRHEIAPLKVNALQLISKANDPDFSFDEVSNIISADTSLSLDLLRLINSAAFMFRRRIDSIKQAAVILGQNEFRKWVSIVVTKKISMDKPNEIMRLSLVRAKFAENLALRLHTTKHINNIFLCGLFSVLDIVMDMPMADVFEEINVDENIRLALVEGTGPYITIMNIIYAYEKADWNEVNRQMIINDLTIDAISSAYVETLTWYRDLLREIS